MDCCQVAGIEELMDRSMAVRDLERYRRKGPDRTTALLIDALKSEGIEGLSLLDIGGGVGVLQHELLDAGVRRVTSVDASSAYLAAARDEAERRGTIDRIEQRHGDFAAVAGEVPAADIVTLDRVICCYDEMGALVSRSAARAGRLYGVVYPRDHLFGKALTWLENVYHKVKRTQFRTFTHPVAAVEGLISEAGLKLYFTLETPIWLIHAYRRATV